MKITSISFEINDKAVDGHQDDTFAFANKDGEEEDSHIRFVAAKTEFSTRFGAKGENLSSGILA